MAIGEQADRGAHDELLSFAPLADGNGLEIVDHIERRHFSIVTPSRVTPRDASEDRFDFPVDNAVSIRTDEVAIFHPTVVFVRNSLGFVVSELTDDDAEVFPNDRYSLELSAPVKLYLSFEGAPSIEVDPEELVIDLESETEVHIGARSYHKQPASTITTTDDPRDVMEALSYFGSALKSHDPERSYPTLRGHPPLLERGRELSIPRVLERPESGITLELPEDYRRLFTSAPLAYYLGADVVPGDEPTLVTDRGYTHGFDTSPEGFERDVERVLKQVFFLDCITRTEGLYQVNLHERNRIEGKVDLDFARLYEEDLPTQLEAYLQVPFEAVESEIPQWGLSAHVTARPENLRALPFVVNDLAVVTTTTEQSVADSRGCELTVEDFLRGTAGGTAGDPATSPSLVRVEDSGSLEQTWIGERAPLGASKGMIDAFQNRLDVTPTDGAIDITVVCNDLAMDGERDIVNDVYGSREELPFDVSVHRELTTDELERLLGTETDFFHYIGHIDDGGFECTDGRYDASRLDECGVVAFFLNACTSYEQGMNLIKAGSVGGVVTLQDVINSGAERVGKAFARLLNQGFPIRAALNIARNQSIMGGHYLVLGDGSLDVAQSGRVIPISYEVTDRHPGYRVDRWAHPNRDCGMGSLLFPFVGRSDECFLASGTCGSFAVDDEDHLAELLEFDEVPLHYNNELVWSDEIRSSPHFGGSST